MMQHTGLLSLTLLATIAATPAAPASDLIFEIWNRAACDLTNTATFSVDEPLRLDAIELWYRWGAKERAIDYTVSFNGKPLGNGTLKRAACDPEQAAWCIARAEPGADLTPGIYTIQTPQARLCKNAGSRGLGFIRGFGSRR